MQPQPAFLLHRRPYRETSALVDLLTLEHGRVRAVAQGVRRPGSRTRSRLQSFAPLHVTWAGHGELKRLRLMEASGSVALLGGEGLVCGLYANEILVRTLPVELPVPTLFAFYTALMDALPQPGARAGGLRQLEMTLLEALDAQPVFLDLDDRELDPQRRYVYYPGARRFAEVAQGIDGRTLRLLAQGDWAEPGLAGAAKALTRAALAPLLGDKPLRSRELIRRRQS
ncbi:DNA repair protein RecO [Pistricoccus aurantiacus]|uniref:DNA repair protein RecO n=1 Tax=Pistricoccus aurantiacus TaxID=1883414 RepID=UPI0036284376